ncbi:hypothetical protein [Edaphobacter bradus]|uniref:hypothetical protein n=1 Tax=Edaphobacter bradus TaxID=2259016 RepID=UPI0021E07729|nr:hypothetical protein [Edaphobacter bradus]
MLRYLCAMWLGLGAILPISAQELPYFVTYSHHMEEPGSLEVESKIATGKPEDGNRFGGNAFELEYGTTAWWTSELYLEGQTTAHDSTVFTGYRIENRVRPLLREHWVNPVLYFEFEDINGANKSLLEVVGHDGNDDLTGSNSEARAEKKREAELKLILSSNWKGWNFSENIIAEKDLRHAPWEFGYTLGASRPLRLAGGVRSNAFALQNFAAGAEMYGGLGDKDSFGLHQTSHYFGPTFNWNIPGGPRITASPNFGLNDHSVARIYRFGVAYEIGQLSRYFKGGR